MSIQILETFCHQVPNCLKYLGVKEIIKKNSVLDGTYSLEKTPKSKLLNARFPDVAYDNFQQS